MVSYMKPIWFKTTMRRPDPIELEFAFLVFLLVVPMGYWLMRMIMALFGM